MLQVNVPNSFEPLDIEIERTREGIRELLTLTTKSYYDKLPQVVYLNGVMFNKKYFNGSHAIYTDK